MKTEEELMMLEFRNNQNENFEENDSVYHYDYINSESNASGNSPKHDKDLRKMMKRAAAIALAVGRRFLWSRQIHEQPVRYRSPGF